MIVNQQSITESPDIYNPAAVLTGWFITAVPALRIRKVATSERNFRFALTFLFFELSEIQIPLFPPPGHAGSDGGGPRSVWALWGDIQ